MAFRIKRNEKNPAAEMARQSSRNNFLSARAKKLLTEFVTPPKTDNLGVPSMQCREWFFCKEDGKNAVYCIEFVTVPGKGHRVGVRWGKASNKLLDKKTDDFVDFERAKSCIDMAWKKRIDHNYTHVAEPLEVARLDDQYSDSLMVGLVRTHTMEYDGDQLSIKIIDDTEPTSVGDFFDGMMSGTASNVPKTVVRDMTTIEVVDDLIGECDLDTLVSMSKQVKPKLPAVKKPLIFRRK